MTTDNVQAVVAQRRWYDTRPPISQALGLMPKFPLPMQTVMAEGLLTIADRQYRAEQRMKELKMLGTHLIMSLYKANRRQRKLDETAELFQLNRYLLVLPVEKGDALSNDMLKLMLFIGRYLKVVSGFKQQPDVGVVSEITNVFTYRGEVSARKILDDLEKQTQPVDTISTLPAFAHLDELSSSVTEDRLIAIQSYERNRFG